MSIAYQAAFWLRNICDSNLEGIQHALGPGENILAGLRGFRIFLEGLYQDYTSFETSAAERLPTKIGIMADDLENYHYLTETLDCLYAVARSGVLETQEGKPCLAVQKGALKKQFKKSVAFPLEMLEKHGFSFEYRKQGRGAATYRQCTELRAAFPDCPGLVGAVKYFTKHLGEKNVREDYAKTAVLFYTADYDSALLNAATGRRALSPERSGIMRTLGARQALWPPVLDALCGELSLGTDLSLNPYVFPNWNVRFLRQKKTVCTFSIGVDTLSVRLPLSCGLARELILDRASLPQSLRDCVESFGCVGCGKCENERNIEVVDGIRLCTLGYSNFATEDSRMMAVTLTSGEDLTVLLSLARRAAEER